MNITVPACETGIVRLFALSMDGSTAKALKKDIGTQAPPLLGVAQIEAEHVEVFPLADLADMALAEYLVEGAGVIAADADTDRPKLAALDGWVMVVYSAAFGTREETLTPDPRLTLIGTYRQEGIDWSAPLDLSTPSALPHTGPARPLKHRPSDAAMSGRIAMAALVVAFLLVGLMIWVAS
jgi:hypothetical protein